MLQTVYEAGLEVYANTEEPEKVASQVAWAAVKAKYRKTGGKWVKNPTCLPCLAALANPSAGFTFPDPGDTAFLGRAVQIHTVRDDGAIVVDEFPGGIPLVWSRNLKALLAMPFPRRRGQCAGRKSAQRKTFTNWHGWEPDGCGEVSWPALRMRDAGKAAAILYDSNKFDRRMRRYVHPLGPKVRLASGGQKLWMLQGGQLRVTARGIEG